ncbi:MAG: hypothetical protein PHZ24_14435 [Bacteroidales bacterium]|jgi:hypothetical protein|nr:hypothetical protein [Bacteroidales bacterium]
MEVLSNNEYASWLADIKAKIQKARLKVILAANKELILFYYDLGQDISSKLKKAN